VPGARSLIAGPPFPPIVRFPPIVAGTEPAAWHVRPTSMNANIRTLASGTGSRATALTIAIAMSAAGLLVAGCSTGTSSSGATSSRHRAAIVNGLAGSAGQGGLAAPEPAARAQGRAASAQAARLLVPGQSIIYTAGLTVRARDVSAAASLATSIVTGVGGYVAREQSSINPAGHAPSMVSLQVKIPVAVYPATLRQLSSRLGSQVSLSQQARDVTGQVANVTSRVASARTAIAQLRALLRRAGSVNSLLNVQDQINAEESTLEALQAQQRALSHETTYATVSLRLLSKHRPSVIHKRHSRGFVAGLSAGWRAFRKTTTWLLTGAGTVLPFAVLVALAAGLGYAGRRRLLRRRSGPSTAS